MNSFHDQLTEHLIKDKELSFVQDDNDEEIDEDDHDEVFDKTQPTRIKQGPQETSSRTQIELKIQDFARDWARTLKQSEYKTEIFRGLTQLGLMENRRNKLLSSFERALNRLRQNVRFQIRKATRDLRIRLLKKFEPELHKLYITGKGTHVKAPEKQIPRGYKIGRIRSPGRLRDRRRTRDFTDDTLLTMNGAGCQLNKLEINSKFVLPQIQTESKSPMSAPQIPRSRLKTPRSGVWKSTKF